MAKFSVNIPEPIYESLVEWAEDEGRNKGNLAAFLLEAAVRLRYPRRHPPTFNTYPPNIIGPDNVTGVDTDLLQKAVSGDKQALATLKAVVDALT